MEFTFPRFRREFSVNFFKSLRFPLGEMSFFKDWVNSSRGDPYPLIFKKGELSESSGDGVYRVLSEVKSAKPDIGAGTGSGVGADADMGDGGELCRFAFSFFPYASYRIKVNSLSILGSHSGSHNGSGCHSSAGFSFRIKGKEPFFTVFVEASAAENGGANGVLCFGKALNSAERQPLAGEYLTPDGGFELLITARAGAFDIYITVNSCPKFIKSVKYPEFSELIREDVFREAEADVFVRLPAGGCVEIPRVDMFMDCGISQADMRPMRYENGAPISADGRIYFTMSSRAEEGAYQSVISWLPGSADFRLEGAIFYDTGDGIWGGDVAASVIYDRVSETWMVWYCSFSHGHILAHGETSADLRHGINIINTTLMETEQTVEVRAGASDIALGHTSETLKRASLSDDRLFYAKYGDEDPDFVFDRVRGKWLMTICRPVTCEDGKNRYRYFLFESDNPFRGYVCRDFTRVGENTGGSIVNIGDGYVFVCGSDFGARARYYKFELDDLASPQELTFDYDDGGFRGWGTVIALPGSGTRSRRFAMLTFDRHCGSAYNWSYGNIYVFTAKM